MPPKIKITREEIVKTAVELVRKNGESAINARSVAAELNCSTQPVFSNFRTMEELKYAAVLAAYDIYAGFLKSEAESGKYPQYKAFGMAYIRFAKEEKELFKLLFMRDRTNEKQVLSPDFDESVKMIMQSNGVSEAVARTMHFEMWACVHGFAAMIATSFMPLELEDISNMISDIYMGISSRCMAKERENGSN